VSAQVAYGTPPGRWVIGAAVLGSGIAFLDGTVVNAALPAIAHDLHSFQDTVGNDLRVFHEISRGIDNARN